jgi:hypothetical protein
LLLLDDPRQFSKIGIRMIQVSIVLLHNIQLHRGNRKHCTIKSVVNDCSAIDCNDESSTHFTSYLLKRKVRKATNEHRIALCAFGSICLKEKLGKQRTSIASRCVHLVLSA